MPKKGYQPTKKHKRKLSVAQLNRWERDKNSESVKLRNERISEKKKGATLCTKGKTYKEIYGRRTAKRLIKLRSRQAKNRSVSEETKERMREAHSNMAGKNNPFYGRRHSEKAKQRMRKARKKCVPWNRGKKCSQLAGENNGMYGKTHTDRTKRIISKAHKGKSLSAMHIKKLTKFGLENPNWQNGISFEPYGEEFNNELKFFIRQRDNFTCQFCGAEENGRAFPPHHINYDKKDNRERNLILLCVGCNTKANYGRDKWQFLFESLQEIRFHRGEIK